ncbi:MAG: hypothetical protein ACREJG_14075 [Candidatus Rokuibacteriota bacterium]
MDTPTLQTLRRMAELGGFSWSEAELQALGPLVTWMFATLAELERLPLHGVEPAMQYRIL